MVVGSIVALSTVVLFLFLGDESLWFDEAFSVRAAARLPTTDLFDLIYRTEGHMALYYALLHGWTIFGDGEAFVRTLSVIPALAGLPLLFALSKKLAGRRAAVIATLLLSINAFFFNYARETRGYSLLLFFAIASTYFFVRAIHEPHRSYLWIGYVIVTGLGFYAHFFGLLVPASHAASLPFLGRRNVPWKPVLATAAGVFLAALPALAYIVRRPGQIDFLVQPDLLDLAVVGLVLTGGPTLVPTFFAAAPFYAAALALAAVQLPGRWRSAGASLPTWGYAFPFAWMLVPILVAFVVSQIKPAFLARYLIVSLPGFAVVAAMGLSHVRNKLLFGSLLGLMLATSGLSTALCYLECEREDWRGVTGYVAAQAAPGDGVILHPSFIRIGFDYYFLDGDPVRSLEPTWPSNEWSYEGFGFTDPELDDDLLGMIAARHDRVWLIRAHQTEETHSLKTALDDRYGPPRERRFEAIIVDLYEKG